MTFGYLMVPMDTDDFIIWLLCSLNFDQILKSRKKPLKKSIILAFHTDFALISTGFVRWGYNFTGSLKVPLLFFCILLTNLRKLYYKYVFCFFVNRDQNSPPKGKVPLHVSKSIFWSIFGCWSIKYKTKTMELWYFM